MKVVSAFIVVTVIVFLSGCLGSSNDKEYSREQIDGLAKCLNEKSAKMFGTEWCSHCKEQKAFFAESFQFVDYVDCDFSKEECESAGVKGYPTWLIDGKLYPGARKLEDLAWLSGCEFG